VVTCGEKSTNINVFQKSGIKTMYVLWFFFPIQLNLLLWRATKLYKNHSSLKLVQILKF
jgi:hypothetical protein